MAPILDHNAVNFRTLLVLGATHDSRHRADI